MSGALASTVVTSKSMVAASMPELFFVASSMAASSVNATRCTLWSLLPTHTSTCALLTIFFNCVTVLSISACVGAVAVLLPRLLERFAAAAATPSMLTSPDTLSESIPSTVSLETEALSRSFEGSPIAARILPASRLLVETPAGSDVPVVDESDVRGQVVPLAVDLDPRLAAAGANLGLERGLAQCDADVDVGALASRIDHAVETQVDRLLREQRELLIGRRALDVNGHIELQLLRARAGLCIDCAEDAGGVATATRRRARVGRARRIRLNCSNRHRLRPSARAQQASPLRLGNDASNLPPHAGCAIRAWYMHCVSAFEAGICMLDPFAHPTLPLLAFRPAKIDFPRAARMRKPPGKRHPRQ